MPVWHAALRQALRDGRIALLGVVQEQHPERCQLFAQWQQLDWPILHDPINDLPLRGVPVLVAIDEYGVVRAINPDRETFDDSFLGKEFSPPENPPPLTRSPIDVEKLRSLESLAKNGIGSEQFASRILETLRHEVLDPSFQPDEEDETLDYETYKTLGDAVLLWRPITEIDAALYAYRLAMQRRPDAAEIYFRLGVAHRMRYEASVFDVGRRQPAAPTDGSSTIVDRPQGGPEDFQRAIDCWSKALELDPNHYIFRRRIQQYGPRLTKPYPFYDWIDQARIAIRDRGAIPIELPVEPRGAERIGPGAAVTTPAADPPDRLGQIDRDRKELIRVTPTFIPGQVSPGQAVHLHFEFEPSGAARWNNEAEPLLVWLDLPEGWAADSRLLRSPLPPTAESSEVRWLETDLQIPSDAQPGVRISAYALYYVCETEDGTCLYLRQDIPLTVPVRGTSPR